MIIYKVTNKINGKLYIGKTISSLSKRWAQHVSKSKRCDKHKYFLHSAIVKYGPDNFLIEIIDTAATNQELLDKEKYYIKHYDTFNNPTKGYNMTSGGEDGILCDEAKARKACAMQSQEYREKIRKTSTGRIFSPESIEKRAIKLRGQNRSAEQRKRMRQSAIGRVNSFEHKQKISNSLSGRGKGVYFKVFNGNQCLGIFDNIRKFCKDYPVISDVSLKHLLRGSKISCKGYTAKKVSKEEFDSYQPK